MRRALHVIESLVAGGIETTFLNVLKAWRLDPPWAAHDVLAFGGGLLEEAFRTTADRLYVAPDRQSLARILDDGYDVVYVLFERCALRILPYLLGQTGTPVVYGKGYDLSGNSRANNGLKWPVDEALLTACDGVTFTTSQLAATFERPDGRETILGKAADVRRFSVVAEVQSDTPVRVLAVANLMPRKRHTDLIRAHREVRRHIDAELRIVGAGSPDERARLVALAAELGISDSVTIVSAHQDIPAELAQSRVAALASAVEGVPTAILEAMAAGRPVVATRVGHVKSIVDDGVEGFLVDPGDLGSLAERITRLLTDPALARRMGDAGRLRAARHDVLAVARSLRDVLLRASPIEAAA
jgi:glycosyltransferase involved in cell wall biosynthesis